MSLAGNTMVFSATNNNNQQTEHNLTEGNGGAEEEDQVLRVRGLPWSATEDDVKKFFDECAPAILAVNFTYNREGRPSGEAYVEFSDDNSYREAFKKDHMKMGHRYIEIFSSKKSEMEHVIKSRGRGEGLPSGGASEAVVRMRGLPFGCTKDEITSFFLGLEVLPNGIILPADSTGRPTGEAYVQFVDKQTADKALEKHMQHIGHRYIEVFRSSVEEAESALDRATSWGTEGGGAGRGMVDLNHGSGPRPLFGPGSMGGPSRPTPYDRPPVGRFGPRGPRPDYY